MNRRITILHWTVLLFYSLLGRPAQSKTYLFGEGQNAFEMEFVTVGNPGNAPDGLRPLPVGSPENWHAGAVAYAFEMGKYEVSEKMIRVANQLGGLGITIDSRGDNQPATGVTWFESAAFVNWLNVSSGYSPAYKLGADGLALWEPSEPGYSERNPARNSLAHFVLPNVDEWFKSAYHDASAGTEGVYFDFPDGTNDPPAPVTSGTDQRTAVYGGQLKPSDVDQAGASSPYGTVGQGGNVFEWDETESDLTNNNSVPSRGLRGGYWAPTAPRFLSAMCRFGVAPDFEVDWVGLRVAAVPVDRGSSVDLNDDGVIDGGDAAILFAAWGPQSHSPSDFNQDGFVDSDDAGRLLLAMSESVSSTNLHVVPEPMVTRSVIVIVLLCAMRLRR